MAVTLPFMSSFVAAAYRRHPVLRVIGALIALIQIVAIIYFFVGVTVMLAMYQSEYAAGFMCLFLPVGVIWGIFLVVCISDGAGSVVRTLVIANATIILGGLMTIIAYGLLWGFLSKPFFYCVGSRGRLNATDLAVCEDQYWALWFFWMGCVVLIPLGTAPAFAWSCFDLPLTLVSVSRVSPIGRAKFLSAYADVLQSIRKKATIL